MKFFTTYLIVYMSIFFKIASLTILIMSNYRINIPNGEFVHFLENTKSDATTKNSSNLFGTEWFELILKRIQDAVLSTY